LEYNSDIVRLIVVINVGLYTCTRGNTINSPFDFLSQRIAFHPSMSAKKYPAIYNAIHN